MNCWPGYSNEGDAVAVTINGMTSIWITSLVMQFGLPESYTVSSKEFDEQDTGIETTVCTPLSIGCEVCESLFPIDNIAITLPVPLPLKTVATNVTLIVDPAGAGIGEYEISDNTIKHETGTVIESENEQLPFVATTV